MHNNLLVKFSPQKRPFVVGMMAFQMKSRIGAANGGLATDASQNGVCKPQQRCHISDLATMTAVKNESN